MLPLSIFRYAKQNKNTIVRYPGENVLLMYCHHLASVVADQSFSNNQLDQMVPNLIKILCGWSSIFYTFPLVVLYKVGVLYVDWKSIAEQSFDILCYVVVVLLETECCDNFLTWFSFNFNGVFFFVQIII